MVYPHLRDSMSRGEPKKRRGSRVVDEEHDEHMLFLYLALAVRFRLMWRDINVMNCYEYEMSC